MEGRGQPYAAQVRMVPLYPSGTRKLVRVERVERVTRELGEMEEMIGGSVEVM